MHEYRMKDEENQGVSQDGYVICKVFEKSGLGPNNGAQYGALYEEEDCADDDKSTVTSILMVGVLVNPNSASCSSVMNITSTEPGPSTETSSATMLDSNIASTSGPSTITSWENEGHTDVPIIDDDDMLTYDDLGLMLCDDDTQEVEDRKGKKVMTDDGTDILQELLGLSNL